MLRTRPCESNLWTGDRQEARQAGRVAKSLDRKIDDKTICDKFDQHKIGGAISKGLFL